MILNLGHSQQAICRSTELIANAWGMPGNVFESSCIGSVIWWKTLLPISNNGRHCNTLRQERRFLRRCCQYPMLGYVAENLVTTEPSLLGGVRKGKRGRGIDIQITVNIHPLLHNRAAE